MFAVRFANGRDTFEETEVVKMNSIDEVLARMVRVDGPDWSIYAVGGRAMVGNSDDSSVVVAAETDEAAAAMAKVLEAGIVAVIGDDYYDDNFDEDDLILATGTRLGDVTE